MKKSEWTFVVLLVFSGLSCLLMSAGGYAGVVQAGWRGVLAEGLRVVMPYLTVLACLGILIAIGSYVLGQFQAPAPLTCPTCKRTVQTTWRRCPYCETRLKHEGVYDESAHR